MRRPSSTLAKLAVPAVAIIVGLLTLGLLAGPAAATPKKKPPGVFVAKIGWFYNEEPDFPQQKEGSVVVHWPACVKAGGVKIYWPLNQHIYGGYNGGFDKTKPAISYIEGPPLNPKDAFIAEIYVGDMAAPGTRNLNLSCMHQVNGKLVPAFVGPLKTKFIHQDVNFNPPIFDAFDQVDLFGVTPQTHTVINRSCEEPGTPSITLSSPVLAAGPSGGATVTVPASDEDGTFAGTIAPDPAATEGKYEAVVSCGSGRVGVGKIGFVP